MLGPWYLDGHHRHAGRAQRCRRVPIERRLDDVVAATEHQECGRKSGAHKRRWRRRAIPPWLRVRRAVEKPAQYEPHVDRIWRWQVGVAFHQIMRRIDRDNCLDVDVVWREGGELGEMSAGGSAEDRHARCVDAPRRGGVAEHDERDMYVVQLRWKLGEWRVPVVDCSHGETTRGERSAHVLALDRASGSPGASVDDDHRRPNCGLPQRIEAQRQSLAVGCGVRDCALHHVIARRQSAHRREEREARRTGLGTKLLACRSGNASELRKGTNGDARRDDQQRQRCEAQAPVCAQHAVDRETPEQREQYKDG